MHRSLLEILACPACRCAFAASTYNASEEEITLGFLHCPECAVTIPVIEGLVLFTEALQHPGMADREKLLDLACDWFGSAHEFNAYRAEKLARGTLEAYAAFQPFNESARAVEPLLPYVAACLQPGEFILDTWCRTGWSGEWLAGRFPQNRVIALWEGNSSVLGYRGYAHLLGPGQRAGNLDVVFTHPEQPLPFVDKAFAFLHGHDVLHRYRPYPFASECLRVSKPSAPLVFAHLHLSNSEPEPFFQRGCRQLHGRDYRRWLDLVSVDTARRGWVFSEVDLFNGPTPALLCDTPDTGHYNGLICLLPSQPAAADCTSADADMDTVRFLPSPLFRFNLARSSARVATQQHNDMVGHLLLRHPAYQQRLPAQPVILDDRDMALILLAMLGKTRRDINSAFSASFPDAGERLTALCQMEILHDARVSSHAHRLQRFHCNQLPVVADSHQQFWNDLTHAGNPLIMLADGTALDGCALQQVLCSLAGSLPSLGWQPGDWLTVTAGEQPLLLVLALMACAQGLNVRLARQSIHPDSICHLHADNAVPAGGPVPGMPLGLDGTGDSLLGHLARHAEARQSVANVDALIELELDDDALLTCSLAEMVEACQSLLPQMDQQVWLSDGSSLRNLCGLIFAVTTQSPFRMLQA